MNEPSRMLDSFRAPFGATEVELLEVVEDAGVRLLRVRIREGKRFTIVDLDPATAAGLGGAIAAWADNEGGRP